MTIDSFQHAISSDHWWYIGISWTILMPLHYSRYSLFLATMLINKFNGKLLREKSKATVQVSTQRLGFCYNPFLLFMICFKSSTIPQKPQVFLGILQLLCSWWTSFLTACIWPSNTIFGILLCLGITCHSHLNLLAWPYYVFTIH